MEPLVLHVDSHFGGGMKNKLPARRFEQVYSARRQHDELRIKLGRTLSKWADGTTDFTGVLPVVESFESEHRKLIETIHAHREIGPATEGAETLEAASLTATALARMRARKDVTLFPEDSD